MRWREEYLEERLDPQGILQSSTEQRYLYFSLQRLRASFSLNAEELHRNTASADLDIFL